MSKKNMKNNIVSRRRKQKSRRGMTTTNNNTGSMHLRMVMCTVIMVTMITLLKIMMNKRTRGFGNVNSNNPSR